MNMNSLSFMTCDDRGCRGFEIKTDQTVFVVVGLLLLVVAVTVS